MNKLEAKTPPSRPKNSTAPKAPPGLSTDVNDVGNMDKIRDILFGNQTRDYEKRFVQMESVLTKETDGLREELRMRMDALETYMKQELKALNERLKNETNDRAEKEKELRLELKDTSSVLQKKIVLEGENASNQATELRDQILNQSKQLADEIQKKYDQSSKELRKTSQELFDVKVNRSDLSGFFLDLAMRLSGDERVTELANPED